MTQQTAVEYLLSNLPNRFRNAILNECGEEIEKAKEIEKEQIRKAYSMGYDDAQCNHINDVENYINDLYYLNSEGDK
jgi:rRNA-processing protein FCF1